MTVRALSAKPANGETIDQFAAYFDSTFSSLASSRRASAEVTGSLAPPLTFAARFEGVTTDARGTDVVADTRVASPAKSIIRAVARSVANADAKTRTVAVRMNNNAPAPTDQNTYKVASYAPGTDDTLATSPFGMRSDIKLPPLKQAVTSLVPMDSAPFPFDGTRAETHQRFLDVADNGNRGHRTFRGRVLWEKDAYSDPRVLLHIPKGFDPNRPSVMIVFFHGHGATLTRDVLARQEVPEQISEAGVNAVLVAPQLAYDAADSSPGKLWEPGAFASFVKEASDQLTRLYGDPRAARTFANMPIVIVAYSGGYLTAASSLSRGGLKNRVRGVVLLDALYGELDTFAKFITTNRSAFFVSAYTHSTQRRNAELENILSERDVTIGSVLKPSRLDGTVTFLPNRDDIRHRDFVNHAWAEHPITDILSRMTEYRL
jgi:hypothetical protein